MTTPNTDENRRLNAMHMASNLRTETDTDADIIARADKIDAFLQHGAPSKRRAKLDAREAELNERAIVLHQREIEAIADASLLAKRKAELDALENKLNLRRFIQGYTPPTGVATPVKDCKHVAVKVDVKINRFNRFVGVEGVYCMNCKSKLSHNDWPVR